MSKSLAPCRLLAALLLLGPVPSALAAETQATVPAIVANAAPTVPAARDVSAEVFQPAPLPNENLGSPTQVASDEPNLHPDLLRMHEHSNGALGDTSSEYDRSARVSPAGGMSLSIPVQ